MDGSHLLRVAALASAVAMLAGCAHVARPVAQTVRVETPGCIAARCELRNDQGAWTVETTPGSARVITSRQALLLSCSAQGQQASQALAAVDLRPVSNTALAGGAVLGGGVAAASLAPLLAVPGFNVLAAMGIVVAAVGGAGVAGGADAVSRSYAYPDTVVIPFQCGAASAGPPANAPLGLAMGQIVEGAARATLAEEFEATESGAPVYGLLLRSARFNVDDHIVYIVPLPCMLSTGRIDRDSRLWVELQLTDVQGLMQVAALDVRRGCKTNACASGPCEPCRPAVSF